MVLIYFSKYEYKMDIIVIYIQIISFTIIIRFMYRVLLTAIIYFKYLIGTTDAK